MLDPRAFKSYKESANNSPSPTSLQPRNQEPVITPRTFDNAVERIIHSLGDTFYDSAVEGSPSGNIVKKKVPVGVENYIMKMERYENMVNDLHEQNALYRSMLEKKDNEMDNLCEQLRSRNYEVFIYLIYF